MNLKRRNRLVVGIITPLFLITAIGGLYYSSDGFTDWNVAHWIERLTSILEDDTERESIDIKPLQTVTNSDGSVTKTFTFTVLPDNTTHQDISASLKYKDGTDCSEVASVTIDNINDQVSIMCHQDFDQEIILTLASTHTPNINTSIDIGYEKKLLSLTANGASFEIHNSYKETLISSYTTSNSFDPSVFVSPAYSKFTKDKEYYFRAKDVTIAFEEFILNDKYEGTLTIEEMNQISRNMGSILKRKIENGEGYLTAQECWEAASTSNWQSLLNRYQNLPCEEFAVGFVGSAKFYCLENDKIEANLERFFLYVPLKNDYSDFVVNMGSISSEVDHIIF